MRLRDLRIRRALTQKDLARQSGVAQTTIGAIERGVELPAMRTARLLAEALGVELTDIDEVNEAIDRELKKDPTGCSPVGQSSLR
jgi:transcriptional regulator with XRE-family HTH domain